MSEECFLELGALCALPGCNTSVGCPQVGVGLVCDNGMSLEGQVLLLMELAGNVTASALYDMSHFVLNAPVDALYLQISSVQLFFIAAIIIWTLWNRNNAPVKQWAPFLCIKFVLESDFNSLYGFGASAYGTAWSCQFIGGSVFTVPDSMLGMIQQIYRISFIGRLQEAFRDGKSIAWFEKYQWLITWRGFLLTEVTLGFPYIFRTIQLAAKYPWNYAYPNTIISTARGCSWDLGTPGVSAFCAELGRPCGELFVSYPWGVHPSSWQICAVSAEDALITKVISLVYCFAMIPMAYWYMWRFDIPALLCRCKLRWKLRVRDEYWLRLMIAGLGIVVVTFMMVFNFGPTLSAAVFRVLIVLTVAIPECAVLAANVIASCFFNRGRARSPENSTSMSPPTDALRKTSTVRVSPALGSASPTTRDDLRVIKIHRPVDDGPLPGTGTAPGDAPVAIYGGLMVQMATAGTKGDIILSKAERKQLLAEFSEKSYKRLLRDPRQLAQWEKCLVGMWAVENLMCLRAKWRWEEINPMNPDRAWLVGCKIMRIFVAEGAIGQINIGGSERREVLSFFPGYATAADPGDDWLSADIVAQAGERSYPAVPQNAMDAMSAATITMIAQNNLKKFLENAHKKEARRLTRQ